MSMQRRATAEFIGTFWLVFGGCGAAVLAGHAIGVAGISAAFGLTVLTMAYAIGGISGCHLNPAVTVGLVAGGRFKSSEVLPYVISQVAGAVAAAALIKALAAAPGTLAANGFGEHSPSYSALAQLLSGDAAKTYGPGAAFATEALLTFFFLFVILGATDARAPQGFAPIAIGLCLTLIHLIGIPVTNVSVNPARSTGPAVFVGGWALEQLWLFWVAPIVGAVLAGAVWKFVGGAPTAGVTSRDPAGGGTAPAA
jgi:aquaporin Z